MNIPHFLKSRVRLVSPHGSTCLLTAVQWPHGQMLKKTFFPPDYLVVKTLVMTTVIKIVLLGSFRIKLSVVN